MSDQLLDAVGMKCPLPVLRARKLLSGMADGERLTVRADDPGAPTDFILFCETAGHNLLCKRSEGEIFTFVIEKART